MNKLRNIFLTRSLGIAANEVFKYLNTKIYMEGSRMNYASDVSTTFLASSFLFSFPPLLSLLPLLSLPYSLLSLSFSLFTNFCQSLPPRRSSASLIPSCIEEMAAMLFMPRRKNSSTIAMLPRRSNSDFAGDQG